MPTLYKRSYTYDASGNRLTQTVNGETTTYTYDDADRLIGEARPDGGLVTYTYDDAGNQTVKESPEGDTYTTYDAANQATVIEPPGGAVELTYNAYYQRVRKENASGQVTKYLYDHKRLLAETDDLDVTTKSYTSRTQNTGSGSEGYGDLISEYDPETLTQAYPAYDAQWNTRELTDDSGDITASYRNTAFGLVSPEAQADWCSMSTDQWDGLSVEGWEALPVCSPQGPFGYGGQAGYYRDPELELYLMGMGGRGRYYDPAAGRFISRDPSGLGGGDLNLYRYVGNNPVNAIDPSGNEENPPRAPMWSAWRQIEDLTQEEKDDPAFIYWMYEEARARHRYHWVRGVELGAFFFADGEWQSHSDKTRKFGRYTVDEHHNVKEYYRKQEERYKALVDEFEAEREQQLRAAGLNLKDIPDYIENLYGSDARLLYDLYIKQGGQIVHKDLFNWWNIAEEVKVDWDDWYNDEIQLSSRKVYDPATAAAEVYRTLVTEVLPEKTKLKEEYFSRIFGGGEGITQDRINQFYEERRNAIQKAQGITAVAAELYFRGLTLTNTTAGIFVGAYDLAEGDPWALLMFAGPALKTLQKTKAATTQIRFSRELQAARNQSAPTRVLRLRQQAQAEARAVRQAAVTRPVSPRTEMTIANPNTGRPAAIHNRIANLNRSQKALLDDLPSYGSQTLVRKSLVSMNDLAALTAHTGDEFLMLTLGGRRMIIRGSPRGFHGIVTEEWAKKMAGEGWRLSGHTHPVFRGQTSLGSLMASSGDRTILRIFGQEQSVIHNSLGRYEIFTP